MKSGPIPGRALLNRVLHRVWEATQAAPSQEAYEIGAINLRLVGLLLHGDYNGTIPHEKAQWPIGAKQGSFVPSERVTILDLACIQAHGCLFGVWKKRNLERQARMAWELGRCIPDYDPQMDTASSIRRPEPFSGNVYQVPSKKIPAQPEPMRGVFGKGEEASEEAV